MRVKHLLFGAMPSGVLITLLQNEKVRTELIKAGKKALEKLNKKKDTLK